ncbi:MAG: DsbA family protein [Alphaproteobacteria bacterium]|nr:DsbA family protein [Alphaproteobacteria bacterium]
MRIALGVIAALAVMFAAWSYFYVVPKYKEQTGGFEPIEVGGDGFAKKTLSTTEIKTIHDTDTPLTIAGNENSPLKVVVFYDYNCPYCVIEEAAMHEALAGRDDVRVVLRPVPFLGEDSYMMSALAMAAAKVGVFPEFHKAIFNAQGKMNQEKAAILMEEAGLPVAQIMQQAQDPLIRTAVQDNQQLAIDVGAHYVPSFVIGDRLYMPLDRDTTPEEFGDMFDQELMH